MPLLDTRGAQTRYDVIWNFTPFFILITLRIYYIKMATSERGGDAYTQLGQGYLIFFSKSNETSLGTKKFRPVLREGWGINSNFFFTIFKLIK